MPRSVRIEYAGAFYHVMARGNRREAIFRDREDRLYFLKALSETCGMTGWRVHAWVLMTNHYHLVIETPQATLVAGMKWLQNAYTRRFNTRHRLWGRLFGDRYKAVLVEGGGGHYYATLLDYVHLNPVRARLVKVREGQSVGDYEWSSLPGGYLVPAHRRTGWLAAVDGLAAFGCEDTATGRRAFLRRLDERAAAEGTSKCGVPDIGGDARQSHLRRGWYWGTQAFAEKLLALATKANAGGGNRNYRSAPLHQAHDTREAARLLAEGLAAAGLSPDELDEFPGSDPRKVAIAGLIRRRCTVSNGWLADHLRMKSPANVSQQLRRAAKKACALPKTIPSFVGDA